MPSGKHLLFVDWEKIIASNAVFGHLGYIGTSYVLDFDSAQNHKVGLTILHYLCFQDTCTQRDSLQPFNNTLEDQVQVVSLRKRKL